MIKTSDVRKLDKKREQLWEEIAELSVRLPTFGRVHRANLPESIKKDGELLREAIRNGLEFRYAILRIIELSQDFKDAIWNHDIEQVRGLWTEICMHNEELTGFLQKTLQSKVSECIENLLDCTPIIIYKSLTPEKHIDVPKLIVQFSTALAEHVSKNPNVLYQLSSEEFEEFIAEIFSVLFGYQVELTARTRDKGRDIIAIREEHDIQWKLLIECKRFSPHRKVGISHVRALYAVKVLEQANKAILATTSTYTRGARAIEGQRIYELELKDYKAVVKWARDYSAMLRSIRGDL